MGQSIREWHSVWRTYDLIGSVGFHVDGRRLAGPPGNDYANFRRKVANPVVSHCQSCHRPPAAS